MLQELTGLCKPNFTVIGGELCLVDINLKGKLFKRRKKLVYEIFLNDLHWLIVHNNTKNRWLHVEFKGWVGPVSKMNEIKPKIYLNLHIICCERSIKGRQLQWSNVTLAAATETRRQTHSSLRLPPSQSFPLLTPASSWRNDLVPGAWLWHAVRKNPLSLPPAAALSSDTSPTVLQPWHQTWSRSSFLQPNKMEEKRSPPRANTSRPNAPLACW